MSTPIASKLSGGARRGPWVYVVQRNWIREFLARRLRFRNPYGKLPGE
ncbi:MAG: hypothetical protein U0Q16_01670 [Bryobacteraceae bacterium]